MTNSMTNRFDLTGQHALVTGAGRGIGLEIARTLRGAGAAVTVGEYLEDAGRAAAEELGGNFVQVDVRDPESAAAMIKEAEAHAPVDILVNNAGIANNVAAEDASDDDWLNVINVNLNGVFWCCRAAGKKMLARGAGNIVNIASMSGIIVNKPQPQAAYNVSKAGVIMLTKSLAAEWAKQGVRVNAVSPGYIGTEMTKAGMSNEDWNRQWLEMTPMGRVGEPADIAHAVLYLASDAARFATGTNLVVDGGYTSW